MSVFDSIPTTPVVVRAGDPPLDEAQLAAAAFLARYGGCGELAALYAAERISPARAALAVLLGLNGLRISQACGADVEDLGFERGHRTLRIIGKGNQPAVVPLVPPHRTHR